jgi:DNA-binding response OmpR family regulator
MKQLLLCSSDPLLTKNLYGVLRDEGYSVETVEHPALAVQAVMRGAFDALVVDSEPFGLSAEDAAKIIRTLDPALPILFVGREREAGIQGSRTQLDIESLKRTIHGIAA